MRIALVLLLVACREAPATASNADSAPIARDASNPPASRVHDAAAYEAELAAIETQRLLLADALAAAPDAAARAKVLERARKVALAAMRDVVLPAWMGMPWGLGEHSTALMPHEPDSVIACGYFVSSTLTNLGLRLDTRFRFAQAPALHAQRSLAPALEDLHVFFSIPGDALAQKIAALGDGLYIIGLDKHIGFVDVRGDEVRLVHASYTDEQVVIDEELATAKAIASSREAGYFVTPLLQDDRLVTRWLRGEKVPLQLLGPGA